MSLELNREYIQVFAKRGILQSRVCIDKFVNISVEAFTDDNGEPYGIRCKFGKVNYAIDILDRGPNNDLGYYQPAKIDYVDLVTKIEVALHFILNERIWDEDLWNKNSSVIVLKNEDYTGKGINVCNIVLSLDNLISSILCDSSYGEKSVKQASFATDKELQETIEQEQAKKSIKKNKNKKGDRNEQK